MVPPAVSGVARAEPAAARAARRPAERSAWAAARAAGVGSTRPPAAGPLGQAQVDVGGAAELRSARTRAARRPLRRAGGRRRRSTGPGPLASGAVRPRGPGYDAADLGAQLGRRGGQQRDGAQGALVGQRVAGRRSAPRRRPAGRWSSCRAAGCRRRPRARDRPPSASAATGDVLVDHDAQPVREVGVGVDRHDRRDTARRPCAAGRGARAGWSCRARRPRAPARTRGASEPLSAGHADLVDRHQRPSRAATASRRPAAPGRMRSAATRAGGRAAARQRQRGQGHPAASFDAARADPYPEAPCG